VTVIQFVALLTLIIASSHLVTWESYGASDGVDSYHSPHLVTEFKFEMVFGVYDELTPIIALTLLLLLIELYNLNGKAVGSYHSPPSHFVTFAESEYTPENIRLTPIIALLIWANIIHLSILLTPIIALVSPCYST